MEEFENYNRTNYIWFIEMKIDLIFIAISLPNVMPKLKLLLFSEAGTGENQNQSKVNK